MCRRLASKAIVCRSHSVSKNLNVGWQSGHKFKKNPRAAAIAKYLEMTRVPKPGGLGPVRVFLFIGHGSFLSIVLVRRMSESAVYVKWRQITKSNIKTHNSHDQTHKKKGKIGSVETRLKPKPAVAVLDRGDCLLGRVFDDTEARRC